MGKLEYAVLTAWARILEGVALAGEVLRLQPVTDFASGLWARSMDRMDRDLSSR